MTQCMPIYRAYSSKNLSLLTPKVFIALLLQVVSQYYQILSEKIIGYSDACLLNFGEARERGKFVALPSPEKEEFEKFWYLILDQKVLTVRMKLK